MPSTPETWLNDFIANINPNGFQSDPVITQLASGHILIVWTDSDNSSVPGSPAGTDVIGRIFDSLGNPVTAEFRLNTFNTVDGEFNPSITALANGGFAVAYDESGPFTDLNLETYSFNPATGVVTQGDEEFLFFDSGTINPFNPVIASASATSLMATYIKSNADGSEQIVVRTYNPATNGPIGAEINVFTGASGAGEDISGPDIAVLSNGNYVVTYVNRNNGNDNVNFSIFNQAGGFVNSGTAQTISEAFDVQVAALAGGGFVMAYDISANSGNIHFRVFDNNGTALTSGGPFLSGGPTSANSQNEAAVAGLADGTFVIVWDDDTLGQVRGQRYSVSGQNVFLVGTEFVVDDTGGLGITDIEIEAFDDGRFGVTWNDGSNVRVKIMDTRDAPNDPPVYSPDSQQIGTVGNDVFTADPNADQVFGHDGNDTITEAGSIKEYFGGAGNDTLRVVSSINNDLHDGGFGTDTIDWSLSGISGATFDLNLGLATAGGADESMISFENLIGTANADIIIGSGGNNTLTGLGGNDTIEGGFSTDTIDAGTGNDTIIVRDGQFADDVDGGTGTDLYDLDYINQSIAIDLQAGTLQVFSAGSPFGPQNTVTGIENANGGALADTISGNGGANVLNGRGGDDVIEGGAGGDTLIGGSGNDTSDYLGSAGGVRVSLLTGFSADFDATGDTLSGFENLAGSNFADNLAGDNAVNVLTGRNGNDILRGRGGGDDLLGGAGSDTATYSDSNAGVRVSVLTGFADGGHATGDSLSSIENLEGSAFDDALAGNGGVNILTGNAGDDLLVGRGGGDALNGGSGFDTASYLDSNAGVAVSLLTGFTAGGHAAGDTFSSIENLHGSAFGDVLVGNNGSSLLQGLAGADALNGQGGSDTASYADSNAGVAVSLLTGFTAGGHAAGDTFVSIENLHGSAFGDTLVGNNASNLLQGLAGADGLFGQGGSDIASYGESNAGVAVSLLSGFAAGGHALGDTFSSIENLYGSAFGDTLVGNNTSNVLQGRAGADGLFGQGGSDTVTYGDSNGGVAVSLLSGFTAGGHAVGDTFSSIENLTGSAFNDTLVGNNGANRISGYTGNDTLLGSGGVDRFLFTNNFGQDTITDWVNGELLDFSGSSQVNNFGDLTIGSSAGDAIITDGLGNQITVDGAAGQINASDFVF